MATTSIPVRHPRTNLLVFVRYNDHVLYNRADPLVMGPQVREAVGWLVYECSTYVTIAWDRDAGPPSLRSGDPKASGMVLLRSDILELKNLNAEQNIHGLEFALRPSERKTQRKGERIRP
jgi:hypothetical protein